ncbi:MAG: TrkH family potassium uptake protein [Synergistetes bacterium]|nr:TrkH family potassium uptake protein [Synergistota bacterium]MCX8127696.1 TrkH family potassium uptake protein [Synergistota bacterium]MDW8191389.1 TrkH family potassium uptake protein [Synergistota bacterium]
MRFRVVSYPVGWLFLFLGLSMIPSMAWSYYFNESAFPFIKAILVSIASGSSLILLGEKGEEFTPKEGFGVVAFGWLGCAALGALPYYFSGFFEQYVDCFFESMSGFTTTGASILKDIEVLPKGILFWRDFTHWLGGMGIIVLSLAILPALGVGGMHLFKAEVPGPVAEKIKPRVRETAKILWEVYFIVSAAETILLYVGGMNLYEALCHTFGTVATGGFSPFNKSIGYYNNLYFEIVITAFMFIAGANFALHYRALKGDLKGFIKDDEFRFYVGFVLVGVVFATVFLYLSGTYSNIGDSIRYASFQIVSILTTTGYVTTDYSSWPPFVQYLLLILMFVGGCAGSTGGAMKHVRILILLKVFKKELYRLVHPEAVISIKLNGKPLHSNMVDSVLSFFMIYMLVFIVSSLVIAAMGYDLITSIASVAATLGNIGPGLGRVGPAENYAFFNPFAKWLLSFCMVAGRLELYAILLIFLPETYRR